MINLQLKRYEGSSMASNLPPRDNLATSQYGDGPPQGATWRDRHPAQAPWSKLSWLLFVPLVFASNVAVAILAWIIVERVMG
jgi:hypothetical protein